MRMTPGFLLIEVLVALVVFVVMVGAFSWFITVWGNTEHDQLIRHRALIQVCNALERVHAPMAERVEQLQLERLSAGQFWTEMPDWVRMLEEKECPVSYLALVANKHVTVKVTG